MQTDDTDAFRNELKLWRTYQDYYTRPPPAMIIEVFLDTSKLKKNETLVVIDDQGNRWNALEALNTPDNNSEESHKFQSTHADIVLERWKIQILATTNGSNYDFGQQLPIVYKKCIAMFRALYSFVKLVPAWRIVKALSQNLGGRNTNVSVNCRIVAGDEYQVLGRDPLTYPLYDSHMPVVSNHILGEVTTPAGIVTGEMTHRNDHNFRVDDQDSLLSQQFLGEDENYFQPSLGRKTPSHLRDARRCEVGSLPAQYPQSIDSEPIQAYGSLSTFHGKGAPISSSPISALRNAKPMGSYPESPPTSLRNRPSQATGSIPKSIDTTGVRRPSLSFQPFKAGSLSSSPALGTPTGQTPGNDGMPIPSPASLQRNSGISALHQARNRSSLTAGMPASLRGIPSVPEHASSLSGSASPRPTVKYSSSFQHRRGRLSYGGMSRFEEDPSSSGRHSVSSSIHKGSEVESGGDGSSGSLPTEEDNISDFLKLLDNQKTLASFEPARQESAAARTNMQLNRFQGMREPNNMLVESMTTSTLMQRSSSTSSRHLSGVPAMIAATSISTSSSPGKPLSPHTPHTPAIPSRLSAASNADYGPSIRISHRDRSRTSPQLPTTTDQVSLASTNAIDIPTSPRPFYSHNRRSSSVNQQNRSAISDEDVGDINFNRSISLGDNDRSVPTREALRQGHTSTREDDSISDDHLRRATDFDSTSALSNLSHESPTTMRNTPFRPRPGRGRGLTPPQASSYASIDRNTSSATSERPNSRYSFSRSTPKEEDDELLFDMSEVVGKDEGRRSLEEGRGGSSLGDRGGFDGGRGGESGGSGRLKNRRW
jgi:autophagy-related protein 13